VNTAALHETQKSATALQLAETHEMRFRILP